MTILEIAADRTAQLDRKPDAQTWVFWSLAVLGIIISYVLYAQPFGDKDSMRAVSVATMLATFACAYGVLVSNIWRVARLATAAAMAATAIGFTAWIFITTA